MRIVNKEALERFARKHSQARKEIQRWIAIVEKAEWSRPEDVYNTPYRVRGLGHGNFIFNVGSQYRLIIVVEYSPDNVVTVVFIGTHDEYMRFLRSR